MLTRSEIETLIYNTVDIVPQGEDSVFLGVFSLVDNPPTLNAVLIKLAAYYDNLLSILPLSFSQQLELQTQRPFTFEEYKVLFKTSVTEKQFAKYPIFKTLLITTQEERLLFTNNPNRDAGSYEAFVALLKSWSKINNPLIYTLIYGIHN